MTPPQPPSAPACGSGPSRYSADLELILNVTTARDDDPLSELRADLAVWAETLLHGKLCHDDPVFEGMVRDFITWDSALQEVLKSIDTFSRGLEMMCTGFTDIAEAMAVALSRSKNVALCSDACKYKECATNVGKLDAPHSVTAKLRRDLAFNVIGPIKAHLAHNRLIRNQLEVRHRRLVEYSAAQRELNALQGRRDVLPGTQKLLRARAIAETSREAFEEVDLPLFEWLLLLDEYREDMYDSLLQTLKYLQYEFLAGSAHCVSRVLPKQMEFRPLVEMAPDQLRPQVQLKLDEDAPKYLEDNGSGGSAACGATIRLLKTADSSNSYRLLQRKDVVSGENEVPPPVIVDQVALALLTGQGLAESHARQALRWHDNDVQAALECVIERHKHGLDREAEIAKLRKQVVESVRLPSSTKWYDRLREHCKAATAAAAPSNGGAPAAAKRKGAKVSDDDGSDSSSSRDFSRGPPRAAAG